MGVSCSVAPRETKDREVAERLMVVATGAGAGARTALGTAVFAGLIVATILGVVLTPAIYRVVQGTSERLGSSAK